MKKLGDGYLSHMSLHLLTLTENEIPQTAKIWENGWHEAHLEIVPKQLAALRTFQSFSKRLRDHLDSTRICILNGEIAGFCTTQGSELYQMYVDRFARGGGVAQALLQDAEKRIGDAGHRVAWLSCAVGNERAAKFYCKSGWTNVGVRTVDLTTETGPFPLPVWRYERELERGP